MVKAKNKTSIFAAANIKPEPKVREGGLVHVKSTRKHSRGTHPSARLGLDGELEFTGPREWCLAVLGRLLQEGRILPGILLSDLNRLVWDELDKDPKFKQLGYWRDGQPHPPDKVSDKTIKRAADILKISYRSVKGRPRR